MKPHLIALLALTGVCTTSCTENTRARKFGGTMKYDLPKGQKVVNATWKGESASIWILTRPALPNEKPEQLIFQEKSGYGLVEGKVILNEQ